MRKLLEGFISTQADKIMPGLCTRFQSNIPPQIPKRFRWLPPCDPPWDLLGRQC